MNLVNEVDIVVRNLSEELPLNMTLKVDHFEDILDEEQKIYTHMRVHLVLVEQKFTSNKLTDIIILCDRNSHISKIKKMIKSAMAKDLLR